MYFVAFHLQRRNHTTQSSKAPFVSFVITLLDNSWHATQLVILTVKDLSCSRTRKLDSIRQAIFKKNHWAKGCGNLRHAKGSTQEPLKYLCTKHLVLLKVKVTGIQFLQKERNRNRQAFKDLFDNIFDKSILWRAQKIMGTSTAHWRNWCRNFKIRNLTMRSTFSHLQKESGLDFENKQESSK